MGIRILSNETINQIAAGEVIERPLSIVKELLENSVDAGASSVTVEIRGGGIELIRVTDNGEGIERDEVRTAFLRHATSKIRDAADLARICSLGFRGEALATIAAVASVELITKRPGALFAVHYEIEGGTEKGFSEVGAPEGTTLIVRDLFKNIPARRKFLRSAQTEAAKIQDIVEKEALAHPDIAFRYLQDGKQRLATLGNGSLLDVIYAVFGRETANQLLTVNQSYLERALTGLPSVSIRGFLGRPVINRSNRNYELYFVNRRFIRDPLLSKAIEDGYRAFLMQHKYPFTVLMLDISPELVDVNVHPQKLEVRFSDGNAVYDCLADAVSRTLRDAELVVNTDLEPEAPASAPAAVPTEQTKKLLRAEPFEENRRKETAAFVQEELRPVLHPEAIPEQLESVGGSAALRPEEGFPAKPPYGRPGGSPSGRSLSPEPPFGRTASPEKEASGAPEERKEDRLSYRPAGRQESLFEPRFLSEQARKQHRIIGQLFETYWLIEYEEKLYIIDQHAAHEKVIFERMRKRLREKKATSQYLLPPLLLSLSSQEAVLLEKYAEYFEGLGYEIRDMGGRDYSISAIPADLPGIGKKELLLEMLDELGEEGGRTDPASIYDRIAGMSCKAAVKGNSRMSHAEADALIAELLSLENPYACPHGRPTIISMSKYELEKKFKRIV